MEITIGSSVGERSTGRGRITTFIVNRTEITFESPCLSQEGVCQ